MTELGIMTDVTLPVEDRHLGTAGTPPRMAVWADNSYLGDATATGMGEKGEWNVRQRMRERYAGDAAGRYCLR